MNLPAQRLDVSGQLRAADEESREARGLGLIRRSLLPFLALLAAWEAFSRLSGVNRALFPPVEVVAATFWHLLTTGTLVVNAADTLWRMMLGWVIASSLGLTIGFLMVRVRQVEDFVLPLVSLFLPIPSLAWIPLFILWFGLSNTSVVVLVIFAATLPTILNTWTGMRSINPVWVRAAQSMNVRGYRMFWKVVLPGSLPFVMTGFRIGLAQAWRAVIAGEMIAGTQLGLGVLIFNSREFLRTDVMLASLLVIGPLGFVLEKILFESVERYTIDRWGMTGRA